MKSHYLQQQFHDSALWGSKLTIKLFDISYWSSTNIFTFYFKDFNFYDQYKTLENKCREGNSINKKVRSSVKLKELNAFVKQYCD